MDPIRLERHGNHMTLTWKTRILILAAMVAVVAAFVVGLRATRHDVPTTSPSAADDEMLGIRGAVVGRPSPEIVGIEAWVNSQPRSIKDLKGKVVLVDFWTYTCINCIRTFPYLRSWYDKYTADGLAIIGVHTPEFAFERDLNNVKEAAQRYGLKYPIALDNTRSTWTNFDNQYWPRKYLIDKNGVVRFDHIGEGGYEQVEGWIKRLLEETGATVKDVPTVKDPDHGGAGLFRLVTQELYAGTRGYVSGNIGNVDEYRANIQTSADGHSSLVPTAASYTWPDKPSLDVFYLKGVWEGREESIRHARTTTNYEDAILLDYKGASVVLVIRPERAEPFDLLVTLDGEPLNSITKGKDANIGSDGRSYVHVDVPRAYNIVNAPEFGAHRLVIFANSDAFSFFAFTFGVGPEP